MDLGELGAWTTYAQLGEAEAGAAAALAEDLGFGTLWLGGSPRLADVRPLLEATERIAVATGIVNVWSYEPARLAAEWAALEGDFPGRVMVGLGVGHREANERYASPLRAMNEFLDGLDSAPTPIPPERRALAALGPKMLDLSAERAAAAVPYFVPVDHTRGARARLGPGTVLATELSCVLEPSAATAREIARAEAVLVLGLRNYTANLSRLGYEPEDFDGGGSDRLIDAVIPHGSAADVAVAARAHLHAGASHVALQALGVRGVPRRQWTELARALFDQEDQED